MTTKNTQLQKTGTTEAGMTAKSLFSRDDVKQRFYDMLGRRADQFMTSVLQIVASNDLLKKADPWSIYQSAAMAATLDLPLNNSIGVAYIIPYNTKQKDGSYKTVAQFQIGYKGFIQLAIRSGQFKRIEVCKVYETDEEKDVYDRLTSFFKKGNPEGKVIGYASYFQLLNGFEKTHYMSNEELKQHAGKYSQTAKKGFGQWKENYESMAEKTVLKLLLSKYAPLSVEMQKAVVSDQAVIHDAENDTVEYVDNEEVIQDAELVAEKKEYDRVSEFIAEARKEKDLDKLMMAEDHLHTSELQTLFDQAKKDIEG